MPPRHPLNHNHPYPPRVRWWTSAAAASPAGATPARAPFPTPRGTCPSPAGFAPSPTTATAT